MRNIVVTGATSGFGHLLVREFLKHGDRVFATGRNLTGRKEVFTLERSEAGDRLIEVDFDVNDPLQRQKLASVCQEQGGVQILINNAGFGLFGALEDTSEELIRKQMETNFFGTAFLTRTLLPLLRQSKGKIFNFSSVFGFMAFPMCSSYCASKFAVEGFTEALHYELSPHGVQVSLIEPGGYRTKFSNNTFWAEKSQDRQSPYFTASENFRKFRDKISTKSDYQDPLEVAQGVLRLSLRRCLPLRVPFGKDATFSKYFRRFAPESVFISGIGRFAKKVMDVRPDL